MAIAQASVYINTSRGLSNVPSGSITCQGRGLASRKRPFACLWMATSSSMGGGFPSRHRHRGDEGSGAKVDRGARAGKGRRKQYLSRGAAADGTPAWECARVSEKSLDSDVRDSSVMMAQKEGGAESSDSASAFSSASHHNRAILSSVDQIALTSVISVARGITMDSVHGSVRSKTPREVLLVDPPAVTEERAGAGDSSQLPSMVELAAAVEEAAKETSSVSSPSKDMIDVEMDTEPTERSYRSTSSATLVHPLLSEETGGARSKRARSDVLDAESGAIVSSQSPKGEVVDWFEDTRPHQITPKSSRIDLAGMVSREESSEESEEQGHGGGGGSGGDYGDDHMISPMSSGSVRAASVAAVDPPLTNEAWVEMLSPLLSVLPADTHPEDYLLKLLRERGYSTEMVAVKETAFHRPPHPDQVAAYDKIVLRAVLDDDEAVLDRIRASGKRMDCCNRFGDSVLHMSCRRGRVGALRYLLRVCPNGVLLTDDFGRTIMHDACWTATPRFDVASTVLDADLRLLRCLDSRGSSPLQYVPQDQWPLWCAFFENQKEIYWPPLAPGERDVSGDIPLAGGATSG